MPDVSPTKMDAYLCTPVRVNYTSSYYIIGFEPKASMNTSHHMLLYGCTTPGDTKSFWNCGEMAVEESDESHNPCEDGSQIIYAWARDAPKLVLPEGVGFKVGGDSPIQYLVLQVHYLHVHQFRDGVTDSSGIILHYTERPLSKLAGVLLLGTGGILKPSSEVHMETACVITEDKELHPFAFRTHTHQYGQVVSGYRVRNDSGEMEWTLLGKRNPQDPQMFYPTVTDTIIRRGDIVAARCTMFNTRKKIVKIGGSSKDEMCNFYLAYWVEQSEPLDRKYCFTSGPPRYFWETGDPKLDNIPDEEASHL
ncbi:Copper type II ascorbate-dependent monooxygenase, C-terminal domain [Nesidiocoris tenuis]|nr:Copper type II ascorbate-dependent monooxygenase, C-terminal domain [Nesidiocoris tenuis]